MTVAVVRPEWVVHMGAIMGRQSSDHAHLFGQRGRRKLRYSPWISIPMAVASLQPVVVRAASLP